MPDDPDYQPGADDPLCSIQSAARTNVSNGALRFNNVNWPFVKLLIALAQASGENMILPTIQLLRVTLITRLLLIPMIILLIITTLVAVALKPGI